MNRGTKYYLIAAIIWTVIALGVLYVLFCASTANATAKICGVFLIALCVAGQWLRYRKMK